MFKKLRDWLTATSDGKRLHIVMLTAYVPLMSILIGDNKTLISAIIIALVKELRDKYHKKTVFSIQDLIYDAKGIFYGSLLTTFMFKFIPVLVNVQYYVKDYIFNLF